MAAEVRCPFPHGVALLLPPTMEGDMNFLVALRILLCLMGWFSWWPCEDK